jgi:hypothetical protein
MGREQLAIHNHEMSIHKGYKKLLSLLFLYQKKNEENINQKVIVQISFLILIACNFDPNFQFVCPVYDFDLSI